MKQLALCCVIAGCVCSFAWSEEGGPPSRPAAGTNAAAEAGSNRIDVYPPMPPGAFSTTFFFDPSRRPYMGLQLHDLSEQLAAYFHVEGGGILIESVDTNGPAYAAQCRAGDVVTTFDGERVLSVDTIFRRLDDRRVGDKVVFGVIRDGEPLSLTLKLAKRPDPSRPLEQIPGDLEQLMGDVKIVYRNNNANNDVEALMNHMREHIPTMMAQAEEMKKLIDMEFQKQLDLFRQELTKVRDEYSPPPPKPKTAPEVQ